MLRSIVLIGVIGAVLAGVWGISKSTRFQLFGDVIARAETDRPVVALTLDDGPTRRFTADVLELLDQAGVKATFFLTGHELEARPDLGQAIVAAGHALGNHSYSHDRLILVSPSRVRDELAQSDALIRAAGYDGPIAFRPPYGQKLLTLPWVLAQDGRPSVMWDVAVDDEDLTPQEMARQIVDQARPGSIILMHVMYNGRATSRAALPLVLKGLKDRGFSFVSVSDLLSGP